MESYFYGEIGSIMRDRCLPFSSGGDLTRGVAFNSGQRTHLEARDHWLFCHFQKPHGGFVADSKRHVEIPGSVGTV